MPGHTLISVYHQYPPNSAPATSTSTETITAKDCVPPEPIPSRSRTPIEDPSGPNIVNVAASSSTVSMNGEVPFVEPQAPVIPSCNDITSAFNAQQQQRLHHHQQEQQHLYQSLQESSAAQVVPKYQVQRELQQPSNGVPEFQEAEITDESSGTAATNRNTVDEHRNLPNVQCESDVITRKIEDNDDSAARKAAEAEEMQQEDVEANMLIAEVSLTLDERPVSEQNKPGRVGKDVENACKIDEKSKDSASSANVKAADSVISEVNFEAQSFGEKLGKKETGDENTLVENSVKDEKLKDEASKVTERRECGSETATDELQSFVCKELENNERSCKTEAYGGIIKEEIVDEDEERTEISTEATTVAQESTAEEEKLEKETDKFANVTTKRKRGRHQKRGPHKKRRVDGEVRTGLEVDDDEFVPEMVPRSRKRPVTRRREADDNDSPMEYVEKRRSGRTANSEKKSYDLQAKWDEMDEEIGEDEKNRKEKKMEEQSDFIIEKIISMKKNEDGLDTYFVKYKNKAYIHCEWKSQEELEAGDKRAAAKLKRFHQKRAHSSDQDEEEQFNSDYVVVERVLDINEFDGRNYVLVKWKSLSYEEVTWEKVEIIPEEKIEAYKHRSAYDLLKVKPKPRPSASDWRKIPEDTTFKDGNQLREYQFEGVNWLLYCYYNRQNCILADEMGLGKTVQTICFLQRVYDYGIHGPFLIVVPLSTIHNWQREFDTWTDMNTVVYHGSASSRQIIQQTEFYYRPEELRGSKRTVVKIDALITTFEMVVSDCDVLKQISYQVCIIDEAHRLKNRNCKLLTSGLLSLTAEHRVLLTGTPLQNNIEELYSLLNFLEPEQFHSSSAFLEQFGQCQTEDQVQRLQDILKPMMLRRLKEDVEKTLQPKEETIIEVIF